MPKGQKAPMPGVKSLAEILSTEGRTTQFAPLPTGKYIFSVVKAEYHPSEEITQGERAGQMSSPRVSAEFKVIEDGNGGKYVNRRIFPTFWVDVDNDEFPFLVEGYRRMAGGQLGEGLSDPPTSDEIAEQYAAGILSTTVIAAVRSYTDRRGEERTVVSRWVDALEG